ncbi:uncharacterized protein [Dysidea avara]|uniref:uncharacterized protein isoform X2 n=1 Tax=Dysidea avara TaxID=196820 RepID=UPI0033281E01
MDVQLKVSKFTEGAITCSLHYSKLPNSEDELIELSQLPNTLTFEVPTSSSVCKQLQAVKHCLKLLTLFANDLLINDDDLRYCTQSVEYVKSERVEGEDDQKNGICRSELSRSHTLDADSTRQGTQVITSMASESFSSIKSKPTPKVNSCSGREPVRTSNSSNTPAVEQLPPSQITKPAFLHHQNLAQVDHNTEPKSEKNIVSSGHKSMRKHSKLESAMSSLVEKDSRLIYTMHEVLHFEDRAIYLKELNVGEIHDTSHCKDYSIEIKKYFEILKQCNCTAEGYILCKDCKKYWNYVEHHLQDRKCPDNYCPLWRLCLMDKRQFSVCKFAPPGMVLFSRKQERVGTVTEDYSNYNAFKEIGYGGFGRVYGHTVQKSGKKVAVKEEARTLSLVSNLERFTEIQNLDHPNVLFLDEYVVADDDKQHLELPLLFVTRHYYHRGLNEPFGKGKPKCLLDYMSAAQAQASYIFRNLLVISLHTFRALEYFASKGLVHRDVKRSNILLKLDCLCSSGIECSCPGKGRVTAILSDFDLVEKATVDGKWVKLSDSEPSGTRGMKAPELFFVDEKGEDTFTDKADIWSAFLTIMHVLIGRNENEMALDKVTEFLDDINSGIHKSADQLQSTIQELQDYSHQHKDGTLEQIISELEDVQSNIKQLCRFQGGRQQTEPSTKAYSRGNYCPKAELLTAVHGVTVMPQVCIKKAQHVFKSENSVQDAMKETWEIIQNGMCKAVLSIERITASFKCE